MKESIIILSLLILKQIAFGQACGIYKINYVGKVKFENLEIVKIKLPSVSFLHGIEDDSNLDYVETELIKTEINCLTTSRMTSALFGKAKRYYKVYKKIRNYIPITFIVIENNIEREIQIKISWRKVKMKNVRTKGFGSVYELNLGEINLNQ